LNREFIEDYEQKEGQEFDRLLKQIKSGEFIIGKNKYPPDDRFKKIQTPVTIVSSDWLSDNKDMWAMIPFNGSLIRYLPPVSSKEAFEERFCEVSKIDKVIDFIEETGRLQVMLSANNLYAYENLDFLEPFFSLLRPPVGWGLPVYTVANVKEVERIKEEFNSLYRINYENWLESTCDKDGQNQQERLATILRQRQTFTFLKLGKYEIAEDIENLMVDCPAEAFKMLKIYGAFIFNPSIDLRSDTITFTAEGIRAASVLPKAFQPKIEFPYEIGKFLTNKLTYAPLGIESCKEIIYHYNAYDLRKVQQAMNKGILTNNPDVLRKSANEFTEILDNIWNDKTIPYRVKGLRVGIPLAVAAIGSVAAGPIGAAGGFLAGLGYSVADKFIELGTDGLSERLAKIKTKNYQANVYDFKKIPRNIGRNA
jgi:hypothetical protein